MKKSTWKPEPGMYWYWQGKESGWTIVDVDEHGWVTWKGDDEGGPSDEDVKDQIGPRLEPPAARDDAAICASVGHRWKCLGPNHRGGGGYLFHCVRCSLREIRAQSQ